MFGALGSYLKIIIDGLKDIPFFDLGISFWDFLIGMCILGLALRIASVVFGLGENENFTD